VYAKVVLQQNSYIQY